MIEEKGLRAQLGVQSVVTGMLLIQLDFRPDTPIRLVGADMEYPELPTIPSILEEITSTLDKLFKLPIPELVEDARRAIQGIDELARSEDLKQAIRDLDATIQDFGRLARNVDEKIEPLTASVVDTADAAQSALRTAEEKVDSVERVLSETLRDYQKLAQTVEAQVDPVVSSFEESSVAARGALNQARQSLATVDETIAPESEVHFELVNALREISAAARSIRHLADYLEQHPEALLKGKGAPGGK
jgi:paraquat-inducible protein B